MRGAPYATQEQESIASAEEKPFVMGKHSTGTPERFDGGKNKYQKE